ncbi:DUF5675 family protein [Megamonas funiformis]|uniref:DUF5675 family protein n=1 Tax=Megamonas funiformis TaxID=437897 RepID=UPI00399381A5
MELKLNRIFLGSSATIGELLVNDKHLCDTLEDRVRPEGEKIYGKTAIPEGIYEMVLSYSPRFKKILPEILNVPNFTGIRIHCGNSSADSSGCILVGTWDGKKEDWISDSRKAFDELMSLLQEATDKKEPITITIKHAS